jgi:excisionase family DNA binding protein
MGADPSQQTTAQREPGRRRPDTDAQALAAVSGREQDLDDSHSHACPASQHATDVAGQRQSRPSSAATPSRSQLAEDELLTVQDVCAWLKVTRAWVYDEVEAGRLPHLRLGRRLLRFRRRELDRYLEDGSRPTSPPTTHRAQAADNSNLGYLGLEPLE